MTNGKLPGKGTAVVLVALTGLGLLGVTMLGDKESTGGYVAPPAPVVTVSQPVRRDITEYLEFTGNTEAVRHVEVVRVVSGIRKIPAHVIVGTSSTSDRSHQTPG